MRASKATGVSTVVRPTKKGHASLTHAEYTLQESFTQQSDCLKGIVLTRATSDILDMGNRVFQFVLRGIDRMQSKEGPFTFDDVPVGVENPAGDCSVRRFVLS